MDAISLIIRKSIKAVDEDNEIHDSDIDVIIDQLTSPAVGVTLVKHLTRLEMSDFPNFLNVVQKRLVLLAFKSIGNNSQLQDTEASTSQHQEVSQHKVDQNQNRADAGSSDDQAIINDSNNDSELNDDSEPKNIEAKVIIINECQVGNSSCPEGSSTEDDVDYSEIKEFFHKAEWDAMCLTDKKRYLAIYQRYHRMVENGYEITLPDFMTTKRQAQARKPKTTTQGSNQEIPKRRSERIQTMPKTIFVLDDTDSVMSFSGDSDEENEPPIVDRPSAQAMSPKNTQDKPETQKKRSNVNKDNGENPARKRPKFFGERLVYPTPLPSFSSAALLNLRKPAHLRNMNPILSECKAFLRARRRNQSYLDKSEYDAFSQTLCERYPEMKCQDSRCEWWRFKKSLSASFREQRARDKRKLAALAAKTSIRTNNRAAALAGHAVISNAMPNNPQDEDIDLLKKATDKREIARLLQSTAEARHAFYDNLTASQIHQQFQHLKHPEMLLLDYLTLTKKNYEELEVNFQGQLQLVANYYNIDITSEGGKMKAINAIHEFFLAQAVKKGAKPVFHLVDAQAVYQAVKSSAIQAPFMVAYIKETEFTDQTEALQSVSLCMQGRLVAAMNQEPKAIKAAIILLASYFVFGVEYPRPYMEFMRAVERFATGTAAPSTYGNTKVKYQKFISLIKSKK